MQTLTPLCQYPSGSFHDLTNAIFHQVKERVEAKNELESYAYSLKNQIGDKEKLGGKLSDEDKETVSKAVEESIKWLDEHQESDKEEYEAQKKKLEEVVQPIVSKIYQNAGGEGAAEGEEDSASHDKDEL